MAAKFKNMLGIEALLIPEGRAVFDVRFDDDLVYSKFQTGAFPDEDQLVERARSKTESWSR